MTFDEAVALFDICGEFEKTGRTPLDSPLRPVAKKMFGRDTVMTLNFVCSFVYEVIAKAYMVHLRNPHCAGLV